MIAHDGRVLRGKRSGRLHGSSAHVVVWGGPKCGYARRDAAQYRGESGGNLQLQLVRLHRPLLVQPQPKRRTRQVRLEFFETSLRLRGGGAAVAQLRQAAGKQLQMGYAVRALRLQPLLLGEQPAPRLITRDELFDDRLHAGVDVGRFGASGPCHLRKARLERLSARAAALELAHVDHIRLLLNIIRAQQILLHRGAAVAAHAHEHTMGRMGRGPLATVAPARGGARPARLVLEHRLAHRLLLPSTRLLHGLPPGRLLPEELDLLPARL